MIGFLNGGSAAPLRRQVSAFHQGLQEAGYIEGHNVAIDYRFAEGQFDRLKAMAAKGCKAHGKTGTIIFSYALDHVPRAVILRLIPRDLLAP